MTIEKGKILSIKKGKAVVEIKEGAVVKKRTAGFRPDIEVKVGDKVIIAFGMIVDKIKK